MPIRMFDTGLWDKSWFLKLSAEHKLFSLYLISKSDSAGFFQDVSLNFKLLTGVDIDINEFLMLINCGKDRIIKISENFYWMTGFIEDQCQTNIINYKNRFHRSILKQIKKHNIDLKLYGYTVLEDSEPLTSPLLAPSKPLTSPMLGAYDNDNDNDRYSGYSSSSENEEILPLPAQVHNISHIDFLNAGHFSWLAYDYQAGIAWQVALKQSDFSPEDAIDGAKAYADYCEKTNVNKKFVKKPDNFIKERLYKIDWKTKTKQENRPIRSGSLMPSFYGDDEDENWQRIMQKFEDSKYTGDK